VSPAWLGAREKEVAVSGPEVRNNPEQRRYEAWVDGDLAGFTQYQHSEELVIFTHTEVDSAYEGQGVAAALVRSALDDVRQEGSYRVVPLCPFVKRWISRHADYASLVYGAPRSTATD
jgi:predicted GNAT family acetyltransferase